MMNHIKKQHPNTTKFLTRFYFIVCTKLSNGKQRCEILYLNTFFQKNKYIVRFNFSNKYIVFIVLQYFRKTKNCENFIRQKNIHLQGKHPNVVYLYKDYTLEIDRKRFLVVVSKGESCMAEKFFR